MTLPVSPPRKTGLRVACAGDSITEGTGSAGQAYPAHLGLLLGPRWRVGNFGQRGSTMLVKGNKPYVQQAEFRSASGFAPDIVVLMLGTNDSKPVNWVHAADFPADCQSLAQHFQQLESRPRVYLCRPPPAFPPGSHSVDGPTLAREIIPRIDAVARDSGLGLIDLHTPFLDQPELFPDHVHPNAVGAGLIARLVAQVLQGDFP